jgi:hypothetical protein
MDKFFTGWQTKMKRKQSNELIYYKIPSARAGSEPQMCLAESGHIINSWQLIFEILKERV